MFMWIVISLLLILYIRDLLKFYVFYDIHRQFNSREDLDEAEREFIKRAIKYSETTIKTLEKVTQWKSDKNKPHLPLTIETIQFGRSYTSFSYADGTRLDEIYKIKKIIQQPTILFFLLRHKII